jgi:putative transposase
MIAAVKEMGPRLGFAPTCEALGLPRATFYRHVAPPELPTAPPPRPKAKPKQTLTSEERQQVLAVLHEDRFVDLPPAEIYAQLLDEGQHLCSIRTMYRILAENQEVRERRRQRLHPPYKKPELLATAPNQVWSWDITKLLGPTTWTYYYLYVLMDIFSRYVVGWLIAERESAELAKRLITESCARQNVGPGQLIIHADRGSAMRSKTLAQTMATLGVTKSHSRPHVSDDNPFSEAQFKTLKYRPDFPTRFDSLAHGDIHCRDFFDWYNNEHHHVSLGLMTPHDVHHGLAKEKWNRRAEALIAAYTAHPERFPHGVPTPPPLPVAAWINKPSSAAAPAEPADQRAPQGAQAGGAVVLAEMVNAAVEVGITPEGSAQ